MNDIKKFNVFKMKMVIDSKKKPYRWVYIFTWWIGIYPSWQIWFDFETKEM